MNSRVLRVGAIAIALVLAAYWYWSPVLAVHQMRSAAQAGDADAFNDHVDYPKLRESLKGQLSAALVQHLASQPQSENEFAKAGTALGAMLGKAMVDNLVDAFVRPELVMRAMQEGKMVPKGSSPPRPASQTAGGSVGEGRMAVRAQGSRQVHRVCLRAGRGEGQACRIGARAQRLRDLEAD